MDKQTLRNLIKERKQQFSYDELIVQTYDVMQRLEENTTFRFAHTVLLYYSMDDEVNTHGLFNAMWHNHRRVLLPRVRDDRNLDVVLLPEYDGLRPEKTYIHPQGKYQIMEPDGDRFTDFNSSGGALGPGMAFTQGGKRLGRGKGYYDRLLAQMPSVYKIGICFPFQLLKDIPTDENDILMDEVIY